MPGSTIFPAPASRRAETDFSWIRPRLRAWKCRAPAGARPQLAVVRGGGSVAPGLSEGRASAGCATASRRLCASASAASPRSGTTAAGQATAHSGAHCGAQQSMSWWPIGPDAAIGQSTAMPAKAGLVALANDNASRIAIKYLATMASQIQFGAAGVKPITLASLLIVNLYHVVCAAGQPFVSRHFLHWRPRSISNGPARPVRAERSRAGLACSPKDDSLQPRPPSPVSGHRWHSR